MPHCIMLQKFGNFLYDAFGLVPYQVGSSVLTKNDWRDVDVRILMPDEDYQRLGFGDPTKYPHGTHENAKWVAHTLAWSIFGREITGLPIDFQIQPLNWANEHEKGNRSAMLDLAHLTELRHAYERGKKDKEN